MVRMIILMQAEGKGGKHVKWDEEALKESEKYRGTFDKIDEPKTPYRGNESSDEEIEPEVKTPEEIELEQSLKAAKANSQGHNHKKVNISELNEKLKEELKKYHSEEMMEDEQEEAARKRQEQFKKKRASHYNEFKMIQKVRDNQWEQQSSN